jgi:hypothetical protein
MLEFETLAPPFRRVARCVAYLVLLAAATGILAFAAIHFPLMGDVFNPHATFGGLMLLGLLLLASLDFLALVYFVPHAAVALYRRPGHRTAANWTALVLGATALVLVGIWLARVYRH